MRIQYRVQHCSACGWSEWDDWLPGRRHFEGEYVETRIVDADDIEVQQVPPFVPAYYERIGGSLPGAIIWCGTPPAYPEDWRRRDDIKPSQR